MGEITEEARKKARAMVEVQSFYLPPYIWRMIWEETVPKRSAGTNRDEDKSGKTLGEYTIYRDTYRVTTGRYALVRLLALWYILSELYLGNHPTEQLIINAIARHVGDRSTVKNTVLSPILPHSVEKVVSDEEKKDERNNHFGWFVLKTRRKLYGEGDNQVGCISWASESVRENIFAIMNTAMEVGEIARSDRFVENLEEKVADIYSSKLDDEEERKEISRWQNRPYGSSLTMDLCIEIRRCLLKYKFTGKISREDEPKTVFVDHDEAVRSDAELEKVPRIEGFDVTGSHRVDSKRGLLQGDC